jgi:alpha-mannosidase
MKNWIKCFLAIMAFPALCASAADTHLLWQIGKADHDASEFALAPKGYGQFKADGLFIVGASDTKRDWPYVQPGPDDSWAGNSEHRFKVIFGVKQPVQTGNCELTVDLVDTHSQTPPRLRIEVNGRAFERQMPRGGGDASVEGDFARGKPYQFTVEFPAALLNSSNVISIASVSGSWMLYDALSLTTPAEVESAPVTKFASLASLDIENALVEHDGKLFQPVMASLVYIGPEREVSVRLGQQEISRQGLNQGLQEISVLSPEVASETKTIFSLVAGGETLASEPVTLKPVRHFTIYLLLHSHNDNGYTDIQPNIAKKQARNVKRALELIRQTKDYPAGSRFKWNLEVFLPADDFYATATPEQKKEFEQAVHDGDIGVDGMYGNLLTGLCRPEELLEQFTFAAELNRRCGVNMDSMMLSDVPGLTWGVVPAMAQNGIKYLSAGPNEGDRIGYIREQWENRPFYWLSQSGREKVLYWGSQEGYSMGHHYSSLLKALPVLLRNLDAKHYPYDLVQLRWTRGDNGGPDEAAMDEVRQWNADHAWPKLVIATTSEACHIFERRYGAELPTYQGDLTPYWEDGAPSSARETALNRHSADRLVQAETLWALLDPAPFPAATFGAAWKNIVLWSEHTWGAYNSVSEPDKQNVKDEWHYKQAYALDASEQSHNLLAEASAQRGAAVENAVDVFNTASWPHTDLVTLPKETKGDGVKDENGRAVPAQRLSTGELVFLARNVPPFGSKRFFIGAGSTSAGIARAEGTTLSTPLFTVKLDAATGAISSVRQAGLDVELVGGQINRYLYLPGANVNDAQPNGPSKITVKESGPLVASLLVESAAPGCRQLMREVRLVDGLDRVEISDVVDKEAVRSVEGVHLGFEFNVPHPVVRINSPGAIEQIDKDQLPGACKNWFPVERWVDISNDDYGVTWATADAPLVEVGGLTANLPRGQGDPNAYLKTIQPSSRIYSWVMNNHWHTNYRAEQEGPVHFNYALLAHAHYNPAAAMRFGIESTEPLIVLPAAGNAPLPARLRIEPDSVLATVLKPGDDGKAVIIRLFNASAKPAQAQLIWSKQPKSTFLSDASERPLQRVNGAVKIAGWDLLSLRVEGL